MMFTKPSCESDKQPKESFENQEKIGVWYEEQTFLF